MLQLPITNLQFTINDSIANVLNNAALLLPSMKIDNCEMKIAPERSV